MEQSNRSTVQPVEHMRLVRAHQSEDTSLSTVAKARRERDWQLSDICKARVEPALRAALHFHYGGTGANEHTPCPSGPELTDCTPIAERAVMEVSPVNRTRAQWAGRHAFEKRLKQALWMAYKHDETHTEHLLVLSALERLVTILTRDPDLVSLPSYQSALVLPGGAK